jgi:hypothetical protein
VASRPTRSVDLTICRVSPGPFFFLLATCLTSSSNGAGG